MATRSRGRALLSRLAQVLRRPVRPALGLKQLDRALSGCWYDTQRRIELVIFGKARSFADTTHTSVPARLLDLAAFRRGRASPHVSASGRGRREVTCETRNMSGSF